ncbi:MAG: hypothetical protein PHI97_25785 [Desulfobulbus sp.]|nr:hypothetical protein [Desulfobulbus sp.]
MKKIALHSALFFSSTIAPSCFKRERRTQSFGAFQAIFFASSDGMNSSSDGLFTALQIKQISWVFFCALPLPWYMPLTFCRFSRQQRSNAFLVIRVGRPQVIGQIFVVISFNISIALRLQTLDRHQPLPNQNKLYH